MASGFIRLFTPEEANQALEQIRPTVERLLAGREQILALHPELEQRFEEVIGNGFNPETIELLDAFEQVRSAIDEIQSQGVYVKDINRGLLDFPSEREGKVVFLCWQYGENEVAHWHELDAGFAGRQPL